MKGIIALSNFQEIACCKGMYEDLTSKEAEFDVTFKCFYLHLYTHWQSLWYCPYCGTKLPNLRCADEFGTDLYADALEEAVGKEFCDITEDEIPEEFKTDEWWKKRGL